MLDTERTEGCSSQACQAAPFEEYSTRLVPYGGKVSHCQGGIVGSGCQRFFQTNVMFTSLDGRCFRMFSRDLRGGERYVNVLGLSGA